MSIALERTNNRIERSGFIRGLSCKSKFESTEIGRSSSIMSGNLPGDRRLPLNNPAILAVEEMKEVDDSCSSSSIGRNSDSLGRLSAESDGEDDTEVQSSFKGPLDTMDALEEVLPIRRGISKFYCGKSKSFTSLADATASSSVKDLAKPENAYTRKRKNLLACSNIILGDNKNRSDNSLMRRDVGFGGGGISSKRPTNSNRRSTFPIVMGGTISSESNSNSSPSPPRLRPPLHPQMKSSLNNASSSSPPTPPPPPRRNSVFSPGRSFSLTDLQGAAADASDSNRLSNPSTTSSRADH